MNLQLSNTDHLTCCLLYTSDAADDLTRVDLGGRRTAKKKNPHGTRRHLRSTPAGRLFRHLEAPKASRTELSSVVSCLNYRTFSAFHVALGRIVTPVSYTHLRAHETPEH